MFRSTTQHNATTTTIIKLTNIQIYKHTHSLVDLQLLVSLVHMESPEL